MNKANAIHTVRKSSLCVPKRWMRNVILLRKGLRRSFFEVFLSNIIIKFKIDTLFLQRFERINNYCIMTHRTNTDNYPSPLHITKPRV